MSNTDLTSNANSLIDQRDRLNAVKCLLELLMDTSLIAGDNVHDAHEAAPGAFAILLHIHRELTAVDSAIAEIWSGITTATA